MQTMTGSGQISLFAQRRPGWNLPDADEIHSDLQLTGVDESTQQLAGKRVPCPKCNRTRALYCYDCREPLVQCPQLQLPCMFSIVTHHAENASKNTGVQAAVLAPKQIQLHDIHHFPDFDPSKAVVLFPSDNALTVEQLEPGSVERVVIIDSKWRKARELVLEPVLNNVRCVKLTHTRSAFWRFHTAETAEEGVCTVEAMLHFLRAMVTHGKFTPEQLGGARQAPPPPSHQEPTSGHSTAEGATQPQANATQFPDQTSQPGQQEVAQAEHVQGAGEHVQGLASGVQGPEGHACDPSTSSQQPEGYHAYDNLLWFFIIQHRHIQREAAKRLEERKQRQDQGFVPQKKQKQCKQAAESSGQAQEHQEDKQTC